ncbi:hypothetical protein XF_0019 [Xylella fastidiosa 9a5c]|uniref:Uncharacterized protein n=1 Tax=Xylella fastidiosa (strain 9a5c) TaxID=160492 RepID=Q9PHC5_XYLFA|nr:hypothetical protein XF_0019 [Xylella fastidiosa 9a5c]
MILARIFKTERATKRGGVSLIIGMQAQHCQILFLDKRRIAACLSATPINP